MSKYVKSTMIGCGIGIIVGRIIIAKKRKEAYVRGIHAFYNEKLDEAYDRIVTLEHQLDQMK